MRTSQIYPEHWAFTERPQDVRQGMRTSQIYPEHWAFTERPQDVRQGRRTSIIRRDHRIHWRHMRANEFVEQFNVT